ncbi:M1 family metallopeptidase [Kutzneria albida]|nr:M1 family metallopeptidase [Kutzneria albida]
MNQWSRSLLTAVAVTTTVLLTGGVAAASPPSAGTPGAPGAGDPYYPTDGNGGYEVSDYHVSISYDPVSHHLDGDTVVTAAATQDLSSFNLDLNGLTVRSVTVNGAPAAFTRTGDHELVITPKRMLREGAEIRTEVRYDGTPAPIKDPRLGNNGWQFSSTGGAFAAGEPHSASTWYPVNDTPTNKASFHLSARVPDGWSVISNGLERGSSSKDGWTTFRWAEPNPIASYLTTVAIDKWTFERSKLADGTPLVNAYAPGAENKKEIEARLPEILDFLSSKFGRYPQVAAGGIFLADHIGFSLETQTRPTYAQWTDLDTIVHENAHQWWGDSVSVDKWKDVCLNECFASYATWLWDEAKNKVNLDDQYRERVASLRNSPSFWAGKLYDMGPGNEFTSVYSKGPMALHALRRQIGERAFDTVLKRWQVQHREENGSWTQFEQLVQRVSGQDLRGFFDAWFHGATIPADRYLFPGALHA